MQRVIVIGSGGAGKSTLSRKLAEKLNLPLYHLDKIHWLPGWKAIPRDEFISKQKAILEKEKWIIDGNYINTMRMRAEKADTIIYLDFPMLACLKGVLKRYFSKEKRPDAAEGCEENLDAKFIWWIITFRFHTKPKINKIFSANINSSILTLKNRNQVKLFIENF